MLYQSVGAGQPALAHKFNKRKDKQMESDCCGARPYFALGYVHGISMGENGKYYGLCGDCREHAEFTKQETERIEQ